MATRRRTAQAQIHPGPDWSLLPTDLIQQISEKIIFKEQYANLRLVCTEWRRTCPPNPCHLIGQVPFLVLPQEPESCTFSLYDFSRSKIYDFDDPPVEISEETPCSRGWFLVEGNLELSLHNPITRELKSTCLPSLGSFPTIVEFSRSEKIGNLSHYEMYNYEGHIQKFILTSSPSDEDCVVVALFRRSDWHLGFCQVGDDSWNLLKLKDSKHEIKDLKYINGSLYTIQDRGQVVVYDLRALSREVLIGNLCYARVKDELYLAIGDQGELDGVPLLVRHPIGRSRNGYGFHIYRLMNEMSPLKWRRLKNIGHSVLLISEKDCEIVPMDAVKVNGWERNHICVCRREFLSEDVSIKMIDIKNGFIKELPTSYDDLEYGLTSLFTTSLC